MKLSKMPDKGGISTDLSESFVHGEKMECPSVPAIQELHAQYEEVTNPLFAVGKMYCESVEAAALAMNRCSEMVETMAATLIPAYELARSVSESILTTVSKLNYSDALSSVLPIITQVSFIDAVTRANWPLYLVDDQDMINEILALDTDSDAQAFGGAIAAIVHRHLGAEWLNTLRERWGNHDELTQEERTILFSALSHYELHEYAACVSMLMCLFDGLLQKYYGQPTTLLGGDAEAFDLFASEYGMRSSTKDGPRLLKASKDRVVVLILRSSSGLIVWKAAGDYIINVILTNKMDNDIALHNPLRNKICHGVQTNYGTWEHAVKAILVTDILIRLGNMTLLGIGQNGKRGCSE